MADSPTNRLVPTNAADENLERQISEWSGPDGWFIGRRPTSDADWFLELKLVVAQMRQEQTQTYLIGRIPETKEDIDNEVRLRDVQRHWDNDASDRRRRAELEFHAAGQAAHADNVRSYVLLAVVAAVVFTPIYAMLTNVDAQSFGQYLAPITGIAGTVIGYWFGQRSAGTTVISPPQPDSPTLPLSTAAAPEKRRVSSPSSRSSRESRPSPE